MKPGDLEYIQYMLMHSDKFDVVYTNDDAIIFKAGK